MSIANKKVAILVADYFEESEFAKPLEALKDAGAFVTVVSAAGETLHALKHAEHGAKFQADELLADVNPDNFDALVLPGGAMNADKLRMEDKARTWVKQFLDERKPVAVICHAPWLLVSAGVLRGRKLTSYYTIQDDIRNAGGEWVDQAVVVDGSLVTSRQPDDLPLFNEAMLKVLDQYEPEGAKQ